jgi:hypothetical protein
MERAPENALNALGIERDCYCGGIGVDLDDGVEVGVCLQR